jgi:hypothetical protein
MSSFKQHLSHTPNPLKKTIARQISWPTFAVLGFFLLSSAEAQRPPFPRPFPPRPGTPIFVPPPPPPIFSQPSNPRCPPATVYDPSLRRCVSITTPPAPPPPPPVWSHRPMVQIPPANSSADEVSAANIVNEAMRGLSCSDASESLRRLSNQLLSMGVSGSQPARPGEPDFKRQWRERIRSHAFWSKVWNRMADAYRSCNRGCFDDGVAVGKISATGYCSASLAVNGLLGPGYLEQPPLPVCETSIYAGCIRGYQETPASIPGCLEYTTQSYHSIFQEYISQDCHL